MSASRAPEVFVDADACPVKDEVYKVALRHGLKTWVVANAFLMVPASPRIERVVVEAGPDAADDWIASRVAPGDVVVTSDIPLADRTLKAGGLALSPTGKPFTPDSIGAALAKRALMEHLRSFGEVTGGPAPFSRADRSAFLQALDRLIVQSLRSRR